MAEERSYVPAMPAEVEQGIETVSFVLLDEELAVMGQVAP